MDAAGLIASLQKAGLKLAIAESLTGGLLSSAFVSVPGASNVLLGTIVAYQTSLKHELLGVASGLLENQGAVDPEVAAQMAGGVRAKLASKTGTDESAVIGVATTGVAGPDAQDGIAVGTVYIAISGPKVGEVVYAHQFEGSRDEIRIATVNAAISHLVEAYCD
ncbi:CinA family protein [Rhodoluna sp.]|uniref:CinA family protein n=1 Tax=Rhodoluna sp. TaxID=1969481 RepID=UPI0025D2D528|nr:CinA family protein [Rhodoluna sp.]